METYTVNIKWSFRAASADQARAAALALIQELAYDNDGHDQDDPAEWLSWFVADAVEVGTEV